MLCVKKIKIKIVDNKKRASHCSALPRVDFPAAALAEASAGSGEPKR